jgi:hemerythrin-like domain-containing protein
VREEKTMERYLNTPIKEIISNFPKVGEILEAYEIGCVPCAVGSCLLKDIIEVHNLSEEDEKEVMARIAKVIYPDKVIPISQIPRKSKARSKEIRYSPPTKKLVDEHVLIKRWIALVPQLLERLDVDSPEDREILFKGIDFIRSYADKFHHAKEEDILFKYFDESSDILRTMLDDHTRGRSHVKALAEAVERRDKQGIIEHLNAYRELLTEHIKKEDEILYPWMDRNLSVTQVGELYSKFGEVDEISGNGVTERCRTFVIETEEKFGKPQKEVRS